MGHEFPAHQMQYDGLTRSRIYRAIAIYALEGTVLENVERIEYHGVTITNDEVEHSYR